MKHAIAGFVFVLASLLWFPPLASCGPPERDHCAGVDTSEPCIEDHSPDDCLLLSDCWPPDPAPADVDPDSPHARCLARCCPLDDAHPGDYVACLRRWDPECLRDPAGSCRPRVSGL